MDDPEHDGEHALAELESIQDERPTPQARMRIEKGEVMVEIEVPPDRASQLLDAAVSSLVLIAAVVLPMMTLKAVPEDLPLWAVTGMIGLQLGIVILVAVKNFFTNKPGSSSHLPG